MGKGQYVLVLLAACGSNGSGGIDAASDSQDAQDAQPDTAMPDTMSSIDAPPMFDFSCVGNPAPTTAASSISIGGTISELTINGTSPQILPLDGAAVTGCKPGQTDCVAAAAQFATVTTPTTPGTPGSWTMTDVATGGVPYAAYLHVGKQGDRQTFSWPSQPITDDFAAWAVIVFNSNAFAVITIGLGINQSAQNGDVGLLVLDCANHAVTDTEHLTFSIKQNGQVVQGTTIFDLGSVNTGAKGSFFIFNVPGGMAGSQMATEIITTYSGVSPPVTYPTQTVGVVSSSSTQTFVRPGYL